LATYDDKNVCICGDFNAVHSVSERQVWGLFNVFPGYNLFVRDQWHSFQLEGWGGFVLKEKLKLMKLALKDWHIRHSQNLPEKIVSLKDKISSFDLKGETEDLLESELE